jgi:hypothetical protein
MPHVVIVAIEAADHSCHVIVSSCAGQCSYWDLPNTRVCLWLKSSKPHCGPEKLSRSYYAEHPAGYTLMLHKASRGSEASRNLARIRGSRLRRGGDQTRKDGLVQINIQYSEFPRYS